MTTPHKTMAEIRDAEAYKYADLKEHETDAALDYGYGYALIKGFRAGFDCAFNESEKLTRVMSEEIAQLKAKLLKFEGMTFSENEALKIAVEALEEIAIEQQFYIAKKDYFSEVVRLNLTAKEALAEIRKPTGEVK